MSDRAYRHVEVERVGETAIVRLTRRDYDEVSLDEMGAELARPVDEDGCRNLILVLGPREPGCLYSVFLAKLLNLHRRLGTNGGKLILAAVPPLALNVISTSGLERFFHMEPDRDAALASVEAATR
ncbi:MAG: STAS domain-containing protein [Gemmataceae bacterium]|nr:STAS domain-containing protein [Gemmataceae bacterium]